MGKLAELDRPMNLYLIGYRGSGKTTVAACLSKELGLPWVDADQQLVLRVGKSIAQIFSDDGEPAFRNHESETLKLLSQGTAGIVALGGGVILRLRIGKCCEKQAGPFGSKQSPKCWPHDWKPTPPPRKIVPA